MKFFCIYVCIAALVALWSHQTKREHTKSLHKFTCRTVKDIAYLGMIAAIGFPLFLLAVLLFYPNVEHLEHISIFDPLARLEVIGTGSWRYLFLLCLLAGVPLMLAPTKGVWDVTVSGDDITIRKCFLLKKHWTFPELEWAKRTRGGLKCYARGRKRMAFFVDAMTDHFSNFEARLQEEHIPIR